MDSTYIAISFAIARLWKMAQIQTTFDPTNGLDSNLLVDHASKSNILVLYLE